MALDADLIAAVGDRTGTDVDEAWLEQEFNAIMALLRVMAPCKKTTWIDYASLPDDVQAALCSALARVSQNPRNIRQETIGEYSYTLASAGSGANGPFNVVETRIITANAGCGGTTRSIPTTLPDPLFIDAPEARDTAQWTGVL